MLSALVRARNLGPNSFHYCRLSVDEESGKSETVFSGQVSAKRTIVHRTGFMRVGLDGLAFHGAGKGDLVLEFGLEGPGLVELRDLRLISVSAMKEAYEGRKVLTENYFHALLEDQRIGQKARPESLFSLRGLAFLLTAYLPLGDWRNPILEWSRFAFLVFAATFAPAILMRRQWADHERFLLPMTRIPRFLLGMEDRSEDQSIPSIWGNGIMWVGHILRLVPPAGLFLLPTRRSQSQYRVEPRFLFQPFPLRRHVSGSHPDGLGHGRRNRSIHGIERAGGITIGGVIHLTTLHGRGVDNFLNLGSYDPRRDWGQFDSWHATATDRLLKGKPLVSSVDFINPMGGAMAFAAGGTVATTVLRQFFAGFWFHPIGFILGPSQMM